MHIFYPIGTFYPAQSGGPSNSVYWLARAMVREGATVTVVSTDTDQPDNTPRDQWVESAAGRIRYVSTRWHNLPRRTIRQSAQVLSGADVVHLTSLFYPLSLAIGFIAIQRGKVVVWSPRGELAPAALSSRSALKKTVLRWLNRQATAIAFHATSPTEASQIRQQFGAAVQVIELPNYMELPARVSRPATQSITPYLLYLGRLHPIKALDRLLTALASSAVFCRGPWQVRLVGADTDGYGHSLRQQVDALGLTGRVTFEPPVFGTDKESLLADAYMLVLPSHSENFGNVVVEALAQGTPVIASTGTPWASLATEEAGFWVSNEPTTFATALNQCLSLSATAYAHYRQQAAALAQRQYDSHRNSHRWIEAYKKLLATHRLSAACAV